ncbi:MAG: hypothetical protein IT410_01185 [Candidatus Doudnabacteria bacterium]|nr:hypothetical protein [Candidatus Doudnabacteria bacterium]
MSALCFVFSVNLMHADLSDSAADATSYSPMVRWLSGDLEDVLSGAKGIKCSVSIEELDCQFVLPLQEFCLDSGDAEVIGREWAHVIPADWIPSDLVLKNFALGGENSHPVQFVSEYSIPSPTVIQELVKMRGETAFYLLDTWTRLYSMDYASLEMPTSEALSDEVNALEYEGAVLLRMRSELFDPILRAWYAYQAQPSDRLLGQLEKAIAAALRFADRSGVPFIFVPIDLEACVVGSHYGSQVFHDVINMCVNAGFPMVTPSEAYRELRIQARHTDLRPARSTPKWEGYFLQDVLKQRWLYASLDLDFKDPLVVKNCLMAGGSDGLVVMGYQSGKGKASAKTDTTPISIGGDNTAAYLLQQYAIACGFKAEELLEKIQSNRQSLALLDLVGVWLSDEIRLRSG